MTKGNSKLTKLFYVFRCSNFLSGKKNLEIKEISKDMEFDDGNVSTEEPEISDIANETELDSEPQMYTNPNINTKTNRQLIRDSQLQNRTEEMFECDQCDSKYKQKKHLKIHIQSKHEGVKYACNQCEYQVTKQSSLKNHILSKHKCVN